MSCIPPRCPSCNSTAKVAHTKFGLRNYCCDLWSWGEGEPLVDSETHEMRKIAHSVFDRLWKVDGYSRSRAYQVLSEELGIPRELCHVKMFNKEQAAGVPMAYLKIISRKEIPL